MDPPEPPVQPHVRAPSPAFAVGPPPSMYPPPMPFIIRSWGLVSDETALVLNTLSRFAICFTPPPALTLALNELSNFDMLREIAETRQDLKAYMLQRVRIITSHDARSIYAQFTTYCLQREDSGSFLHGSTNLLSGFFDTIASELEEDLDNLENRRRPLPDSIQSFWPCVGAYFGSVKNAMIALQAEWYRSNHIQDFSFLNYECMDDLLDDWFPHLSAGYAILNPHLVLDLQPNPPPYH